MYIGEIKDQMILDWYVGLQRHIVATPSFRPLMETVFPFAPEAYKDLADARDMFSRVVEHTLLTPDEPTRRLIIDAIADYQSKKLRFAPPEQVFGPPDPEALSRLRAKGWAQLPALPKNVWQPIRDAISAEPVFHFNDFLFEKPLSIEEAREEEHVALLSTPTILQIPQVRDILYSRDLLSLVSAYLGCVPFLLFPTAWWSFAGFEEAKDAQLFHSDFDDLQFCKIFIYLTDVGAEDGPHAYLEGTHTSALLEKAANAYPGGPEAFMDWYRNNHRKSDQEVAEYVGRDAVRIQGQAGSMFIADTRGFHKGELPVANDRLVCQFTYGVSPRRVAIQREALQPPDSSMPMRERKIYRYVNRMFLT